MEKAAFQEDMKALFDICSSYCPPISDQYVKCKITKYYGYQMACYCDINVPKCEVQFLLDHRDVRKMKIAGIDIKVTMMCDRVTLSAKLHA